MSDINEIVSRLIMSALKGVMSGRLSVADLERVQKAKADLDAAQAGVEKFANDRKNRQVDTVLLGVHGIALDTAMHDLESALDKLMVAMGSSDADREGLHQHFDKTYNDTRERYTSVFGQWIVTGAGKKK